MQLLTGLKRAAMAVLAAAGVALLPRAHAEFDVAPFAEESSQPAGLPNWRVLGPLADRRSPADLSFTQTAFLRPLWVELEVPGQKITERDYLWPVGFSRNRPDGDYDYFLLYFRSDDAHGPNSRRWLLPVVFYGHDSHNRRYFALFPAGGRIGDWLTFDRVDFALFPLWVRSLRSDTKTDTVLWPVFSHTTGPRVEKWRVFPLYGSVTTAAQRQTFILWPFGHTLTQFRDRKGNEGGGWFILPFYGQFERRDAEGRVTHSSWTVLWPFFSGEKGLTEQENRLYAPWPFIRLESAEGKKAGEQVSRVNYWPVYGREVKPGRSMGYILWPFWWEGRSVAGKVERSYSNLLPFWWAADRADDGRPTWSFREVWPVWRRERQGERSRDAVLSLWPARASKSIDRGYAPFWTLYTRDAAGRELRHDVLWGLAKYYENAAPGESLRWSLFPVAEYRGRENDGYSFKLLKGLFGWGEDAGQRQMSLFWFTIDAGAVGR